MAGHPRPNPEPEALSTAGHEDDAAATATPAMSPELTLSTTAQPVAESHVIMTVADSVGDITPSSDAVGSGQDGPAIPVVPAAPLAPLVPLAPVIPIAPVGMTSSGTAAREESSRAGRRMGDAGAVQLPNDPDPANVTDVGSAQTVSVNLPNELAGTTSPLAGLTFVGPANGLLCVGCVINQSINVIEFVGVMQVMPSTWEWVETALLRRQVRRTAAGNVLVGVTYLRHLLDEFAGDQRLAVAAWLQGPFSVQRDGVQPETMPFVNAVLDLSKRV